MYVDNWYKSDKIVQYLEKNRIVVCGTDKATWSKVPKSFKDEPLEKIKSILCPNHNVLTVHYHNKK